jgi:hypothetical protein
VSGEDRDDLCILSDGKVSLERVLEKKGLLWFQVQNSASLRAGDNLSLAVWGQARNSHPRVVKTAMIHFELLIVQIANYQQEV